MLSKLLIPCLDVRDGQVVKGVRFRDHVVMGAIEDLALRHPERVEAIICLENPAAPHNPDKSPLTEYREMADQHFLHSLVKEAELQKEAFAVGEASRAAHATRTDESHNGGNDQLAFEAALGEERYCARPIEPVWQAMPPNDDSPTHAFDPRASTGSRKRARRFAASNTAA